MPRKKVFISFDYDNDQKCSQPQAEVCDVRGQDGPLDVGEPEDVDPRGTLMTDQARSCPHRS